MMFRKSRFDLRSLLHATMLCAAVLGLMGSARAQTDQAIYTDTLQNGWENWGWATLNYNNASPVHGGSASVSVNAGPNQAIYMHHADFDTAPYSSLSFWIHGGGGGQRLQVQAVLGAAAQTAFAIPPLTSGWQQVTISLTNLGVTNQPNMTGFWIQDVTGTTQPMFYVDDVRLIAGPPQPTPTPAPVTVSVDVAAKRHAISPLIYGSNFAGAAASDLNVSLNRSGGNAMTRYNWKQNATNRGFDWYFLSVPEDGPATPGASINTFVRDNKAAGARSMVTVPLIGWVAKINADRSYTWSFSVAKYGAQQYTEPGRPDAGNGVRPDGSLITGNDPNDANVPTNVAFMKGWIQQLVNTFGPASSGGVRYYGLDNESSIWHSTHRDVFPVGLKMDDAFARMRDYAAMIKSVDASAQIVGPEEWGWLGYLLSGYDQQWGGLHNDWTNLPDRAAHGGQQYAPWLLQKFKADEATRGQRLLDIFSLHYYPQGGEYGNDVSPSMQLRRNRSTRSLWDPNYTDETWINDKIRLIPRMKQWVKQYYPGTKIGLTEYNWGAENHINGATAQADVLGILGREGMDIATFWTTPAPNSPAYNAIKMYRNYDGAKGKFGDTSVSCTVPDPDTLSAFASQDAASGTVKIMVVSKRLSGTSKVNISLSNFTPASPASVYQLTSANQITRLPNLAATGTTLTHTVPGQSITLFVLQKQN